MFEAFLAEYPEVAAFSEPCLAASPAACSEDAFVEDDRTVVNWLAYSLEDSLALRPFVADPFAANGAVVNAVHQEAYHVAAWDIQTGYSPGQGP